jgi:hypothetical protein
MAGAKGPNDNDSDFLIPDDDDDEQQDDNGLPTSKKSNVIPNFRGKVPEPELPDSKGPIQVPILSSLLFPFQLHSTLRIVRRSPFRPPEAMQDEELAADYNGCMWESYKPLATDA